MLLNTLTLQVYAQTLTQDLTDNEFLLKLSCILEKIICDVFVNLKARFTRQVVYPLHNSGSLVYIAKSFKSQAMTLK